MKNSLSLDEKFIINIFKKYLKAKIILQKVSLINAQKDINSLQEKEQYYHIVDSNQLVEYQKYLQVIKIILSLLPKEEYDCLVKDFLKTDVTWWTKYYSWNAYQKLRNKAINRFLYLFLI